MTPEEEKEKLELELELLELEEEEGTLDTTSEAAVVDPTTAQFTEEEGFAEATIAVDKAEADVDKVEAADVGVMDALSVNIIDNLTLGNYDTAMPAIANLLEDLPPEKQKELYAIRQKAVTEEYPTASKVGEILGEALALVGGVKGAKMLYSGGKSAVKGTSEIYKKIPKEIKDFVLNTMDMMATGSPRSGYYAAKQMGSLGKKAVRAVKSIRDGKPDMGEIVKRLSKAKSSSKPKGSSVPSKVSNKSPTKEWKKGKEVKKEPTAAEKRMTKLSAAKDKKVPRRSLEQGKTSSTDSPKMSRKGKSTDKDKLDIKEHLTKKDPSTRKDPFKTRVDRSGMKKTKSESMRERLDAVRKRAGKDPYTKKEWEALNKSRDKGMTGY